MFKLTQPSVVIKLNFTITKLTNYNYQSGQSLVFRFS